MIFTVISDLKRLISVIIAVDLCNIGTTLSFLVFPSFLYFLAFCVLDFTLPAKPFCSLKVQRIQ